MMLFISEQVALEDHVHCGLFRKSIQSSGMNAQSSQEVNALGQCPV